VYIESEPVEAAPVENAAEAIPEKSAPVNEDANADA